MYKAYVTYVTNIRPATNADRLNACEVFGNTTIIDKTITEDSLVLYLPSDGQISVEFGEKNNLFRRKDDAGNNVGGFIDPDKRNITAIRLRGNRSDGLVLPISCLNYCYAHGDASIELRAGDVIDGLVNGHEICCKYIPRSNFSHRAHQSAGNKTRKKKVPTAPLFKEHADTEQLAYNLSAFKPGDEIEITLKMHGTSQRTGYLPVLKGYNFPHKFRHLIFKIFSKKEDNIGWLRSKILEWSMKDISPIYDYGYVSGTRRVVLENYEGGFYGDNAFREQHSKIFEGKLWKGETVYYEVVGFTSTGAPIMASANNAKLQDKEFIKQYGKETVFSYGCDPVGGPDIDGREDENGYLPRLPQSDIYVYRMTMTNPDGEVVEYTPDFMRYRCEQMAVKTVPVFAHMKLYEDGGFVFRKDGTYFAVAESNLGEFVMAAAEEYYDGPDPIGKTHVREGVVVRIINRPKFCAYKHKNFSFKVLEGIAKVEAEAPDLEEAQEVTE